MESHVVETTGGDFEVVTRKELGWVISRACAAPVRDVTAEHVPEEGYAQGLTVITTCTFI